MLRFLKIAAVTLLAFFLASSQTQANPAFRNKDYSLALEAIFGMGVRLQTLLDTSDGPAKNFIVSPISATVLISELLLGAEGKFQQQLIELLSLPKQQQFNTLAVYNEKNQTQRLAYSNLHLQLSALLKALKRSADEDKQFILTQNSGIFVNDKITLKRSFCRNLNYFYDAEVFRMNFSGDAIGAQKLINNWASKHTKGLIPEVLKSPPTPSTASLFLNAVYFNADWAQPFSDSLNQNNSFFTSATDSVQVTYMQNLIEEILYQETDQYKLVSLPYKKNHLGMYILLPNEGHKFAYDIQKFAASLNANHVLDAIKNAKLRDVIVKIPKLSLSNTISVLKPLQKYKGFKNSNSSNVKGPVTNNTLFESIERYKNFTANVDEDIILTAAAKEADLRISDIVQELVFSINEKGTEAAAITAGIVDYIGGSKGLVLNRPFVFFIRHESTTATLFWGTIANPALQ